MQEKHYTVREEIANSLTHGIGAALSVIGLIVLVVMAVRAADPWRIAGASVFGGSLIALYLASTLYHGLPFQRMKRILRTLDHCMIYFLIAGTYTPFLLVSMRGAWGWTLFGVMWGIAVVGCAFKMFFIGKWDRLSTALYLAMGWMVLVAIKPAIEMIPTGGLVLMAIGGLAYTLGVVFYLWERFPYNHAIWHGFVMAGSATHFFGILYYVILWQQAV